MQVSIEELEIVDYSELKLGDAVNYPINYYELGLNIDQSYLAHGGGTGWRILSVDNSSGKSQVKLVSKGIPLAYKANNLVGDGNVTIDVENLTTNFFNTEYKDSAGKDIGSLDEYNHCFSQNGFYKSSMQEIKQIFLDNEFTDVYSNGNPKVQSITKEDYDILSTNSNLTILSSSNPSDKRRIPYWIAYKVADSLIGCYDTAGQQIYGAQNYEFGVRVVVTLKPNVKFIKNSTTGGLDLSF